MNLNDLQTFVWVAQSGTLSGAAKRLGIPKSTVSRRIQRLEDAIGHELLRRTPRSVVLTEQGKALYLRSAPPLRELQDTAEAISHVDTEPTGILRITTVPGFGHSHFFVQCIQNYILKYPKTTVDIELTTRLVDMIDEGFDVAIRMHQNEVPGSASLMSRKLLRLSRAMYATETYIREKGEPQILADLTNHRLVAHAIVDRRPIQWHLNGKPIENAMDYPNPRLLVNDSTALERFALAGAGIAILDKLEGEMLAKDAKLIRVLPGYEQLGASASLVWPTSRHMAPRVRAFIQHAVEWVNAE